MWTGVVKHPSVERSAASGITTRGVTLKLIGYVRVSTNGQVKDGYGLDIQRSEIRTWARGHHHRIVGWFSDEGVSGAKDAADRDGLAGALGSIVRGEADGLVVAKLDRLARALHVQEAALAHIWRSGGRVYTVDQGEVAENDPDDPYRIAMRQMAGVFSELERRMISKRLRDGRRFKHQQGGYAHGAPSLGYRAEGKALVPDDAEQVVLQRITDLRATGASLRAIAATLTHEGFATKRGGKWHPETLRLIVERAERPTARRSRLAAKTTKA